MVVRAVTKQATAGGRSTLHAPVCFPCTDSRMHVCVCTHACVSLSTVPACMHV